MKEKDVEELHEIVKGFVASLEGRYSKMANDQFLAALLTKNIQYQIEAQPKALLENSVYAATCYVFETVLEYMCKQGYNGHQTAQHLCDWIKESNWSLVKKKPVAS